MSSLTEHATLRRSLLRRFAPVAGQTTVGIAVSGGADSLALMLLANEWARHHRDRVRLIVDLFDHGLRREAASEVAFVVREATRLGLEARALCWTGEKPKAGVQAAARSARYRLIAEAMRADGANILLTAHHQHDQAETVLMRLAHGSGLEGLRGMDNIAEMEGLTVFRPLLDVPPAALRALVEEAGLVPVADPSNADRHYERVRWRQVLPKLADLGLDGGQIAQFARRAGEADLALGQWAAACFAGLVAVDPLGAAQLPFADFSALPAAVGIRLLARLLEFSGGGTEAAGARGGGKTAPAPAGRCAARGIDGAGNERPAARRSIVVQPRSGEGGGGADNGASGGDVALGSALSHRQPLEHAVLRPHGHGIFAATSRATGGRGGGCARFGHSQRAAG